jgi:hypothetical protein
MRRRHSRPPPPPPPVLAPQDAAHVAEVARAHAAGYNEGVAITRAAVEAARKERDEARAALERVEVAARTVVRVWSDYSVPFLETHVLLAKTIHALGATLRPESTKGA